MAKESIAKVFAVEKGAQGILWVLIFTMVSLLALGLLLVWINIERTKLSYHQTILEKELGIRKALNSQLANERDNLLAPKYLGDRAEKLGLFVAKPGQIRRIGQADEEEPAQVKVLP